MNNSNTIFFTSCDNNYIKYAIVSLLAIRDYDREAHLAIISNKITEENRLLLQKSNIEYYSLDMSNSFSPQPNYPEECFYWFAGPELFFKKNYRYSVYLDADVICSKYPYLNTGPIGIAGVAIDETEKIFGTDIVIIKKLYKCSKNNLTRRRINAGVIYFNNSFAFKKQLLANAKNIFLECANHGIPRKGDDSLFALFQLLYCKDRDIRYLCSRYNYIPSIHSDLRTAYSSIFFHFSPINKPWTKGKSAPYQIFYRRWRKKYFLVYPLQFAKDILLPKK